MNKKITIISIITILLLLLTSYFIISEYTKSYFEKEHKYYLQDDENSILLYLKFKKETKNIQDKGIIYLNNTISTNTSKGVE
jgi:hypothetical protein